MELNQRLNELDVVIGSTRALVQVTMGLLGLTDNCRSANYCHDMA